LWTYKIKGRWLKIYKMKNIRKDIEIRRFIEWSKIVRGKPIQIRLYELIYFELLNLWIELKTTSIEKINI